MGLPRHQRTRRSFAGTFERDHEQTIEAMDRGGHDIPNQAPSTPLGLRNIGVKRSAIPVVLRNPLGGKEPVHLSCTVDARVSLAAAKRGIHVSRIGDLLARRSGEVYPSLLDYADSLNADLRAAQKSESAMVAVEGIFTYLEEISGVKQKQSLEHLQLFAAADFDQDRSTRSCGIGFSHITACPCVQETYRNSFAGKGSERARAGKQVPLITHTQRCQTRITITRADEFPGLSELLACIDPVVVRNQNTLPREFELLNVHRAHAEPQFLEDVLRDLTRAVHRLVREKAPEGKIRIQSVSLESIHDFDMEGEIEFSVKDLDKILRGKTSAHLNGSVSLNGHAQPLAAEPVLQKAGRKKPGVPSRMKISPQGHSSRR